MRRYGYCPGFLTARVPGLFLGDRPVACPHRRSHRVTALSSGPPACSPRWGLVTGAGKLQAEACPLPRGRNAGLRDTPRPWRGPSSQCCSEGGCQGGRGRSCPVTVPCCRWAISSVSRTPFERQPPVSRLCSKDGPPGWGRQEKGSSGWGCRELWVWRKGPLLRSEQSGRTRGQTGQARPAGGRVFPARQTLRTRRAVTSSCLRQGQVCPERVCVTAAAEVVLGPESRCGPGPPRCHRGWVRWSHTVAGARRTRCHGRARGNRRRGSHGDWGHWGLAPRVCLHGRARRPRGRV